MKVEAWKKVLERGKAIGMVDKSREWDFVRDKMYGVWKSRTLNKKDNARNTGTGGGKEKKFDEVDLKILEIIGTDSPTVEGLGLPEAGGKQLEENTHQPECDNPSTSYTPEQQNNKENNKRKLFFKKSTFKSQKKSSSSTTTSFSKEKEQLVMELLRTEIHLRKLQSLKLEKELGLPLSSVTESLLNDSKFVNEELNSTTTNSTSDNNESALIPLLTSSNNSVNEYNQQILLNVDNDGNITWNQV